MSSQVLEWTKLSDLTKDSRYGNLTQKAEDVLLDPRPKSAEPFPGLVGTHVDIVTGQFQPGVSSWGGSSDSFYEYLLKIYLYDTKMFSKYRERWVAAADSTIDHLASTPVGHPDITFLGQYDAQAGVFIPLSGHMECFAGGNFLLGGLALEEQRYTNFGLVSKRIYASRHLLTCVEINQRLSSHLHLHKDGNRA
jgi:mannosyl-oligosaccharide alpha-1,2-mannosidase